MLVLFKKPSRLGFFSLLLGGLLGCGQLTTSFAFPGLASVTSIEQLQQQPNQRTVYLQGKVGDRAPFVGSGAYQLQDSTGTVWVFSEQSLPQPGTEIRIKGQLNYASIPVGEQDLGEVYVIQLQQLEQPNQTKPPAKPVEDLFMPHKSQ